MDDKQLNQIQQEIMQELDKESKIEKEIINSSEAIAIKLKLSGKARANIDESDYTFIYRIINSKKQIAKNKFNNIKVIVLTVSNDFKFKVNRTKYRPFFCTAEMNLNQDLKENLKAMVEAFIRHKTGRMKPEILEE